MGGSNLKKIIKEVEEMYPETTSLFKQQQHEQYHLFCLKQYDYGPGNISVGTQLINDDEVQFSILGLWFRINDKIQRLKNIFTSKQNPQNESVQDSFMDLANYCNIALIVLKRKWAK
tara:strand:- start:33 stop:383 length:351 start_codon:yes stop_codon:yes gene_type:complete